MKRFFAAMLILLGLTLPLSARGAELILTPVQSTTVRTAEGGTVVLVQFDVASLSNEGRIVRAMLRYSTDCRESKGVSVIAEIVTESWVGEEDAGSAWDLASILDDKANIRLFESDECHDGVISLDLTPLVRSWVNGTAANHGLILRGSSLDQVVAAPVADDKLPLPELRIVYRPQIGVAR